MDQVHDELVVAPSLGLQQSEGSEQTQDGIDKHELQPNKCEKSEPQPESAQQPEVCKEFSLESDEGEPRESGEQLQRQEEAKGRERPLGVEDREPPQITKTSPA